MNQHQKLGLFASHDSYGGKGQSYGMLHRGITGVLLNRKKTYFIFSSSNVNAKQTGYVMRKPFGGWELT